LLLIAACGKETAPASTAEAPASAQNSTPDQVVEIPDTAAAAAMLAKWTGDLDGMIERRVIRVLTTYSKTMFFIDKGAPRGHRSRRVQAVRGRPEQAPQEEAHPRAGCVRARRARRPDAGAQSRDAATSSPPARS
jgi:hypothetical protein